MKNFRPHNSIVEHQPLFNHSTININQRSSNFLKSGNCTGVQEEHIPTDSQLIALGKRLFKSRARRANFIAPSLFGEPGWDMLLALFIAEPGGYRMTVSRVCEASHGPATTALRWLSSLEELGLVRRFKNPLDARVFFLELEPAARVAINGYLADTWNSLFAEENICPSNPPAA